MILKTAIFFTFVEKMGKKQSERQKNPCIKKIYLNWKGSKSINRNIIDALKKAKLDEKPSIFL